MTPFHIRVYIQGDAANPIHTEEFIGSDLEAERRLSDVWTEHTPVDGTGYRATLRRANERRICHSIEA